MADDSDSPLSDAQDSLPPDSTIERALRDVVVQVYASSNFEDLTLKRVRAAVAKELDLPNDFLKSDDKWGTKSKEIVNDQVAKCETEENETSKSKPAPKPVEADAPKENKSPKRKSAPDPARANKKRKPSPDIPDVDAEKQDSKETKRSKARAPKPPEASPQKHGGATEAELGPDSELSDVIDEPPQHKTKAKRKAHNASSKPGRSKAPASAASNAKAKAKAKPKPTAPNSTTDEEEEIKRLQAQLVKCGTRRVWGRELANLSTPAHKISHLKGMLRDVGMTGRFSEEKARQIKEERELKADLEAIQEGEERWGKAPQDGPRRLMAKGLMELQGLVDDDAEESD